MFLCRTAHRLALCAGLALPSAALAQQAGLEAIARPEAAGQSPVSFMLEARRSATRMDGDTAARIYGGRPAQEGAWPHQVALMQGEPIAGTPGGTSYYQFCGGSLIARQWVLTAAHCVYGPDNKLIDPETIRILTGSNALDEGGELRAVAKIIPHEGYDPVVVENDVAVIKLAEPVQGSNGPVGAIPVMTPGQPLPEGPAVVVGWGLMEGRVSPNELMETDIDIVPNATCNRGMAEQTKRDFGAFLTGMGAVNKVPTDKLEQAYQIVVANLGNALSENMICAGVASGERTSCNGDSGGPLMIRQDNGKWLQVGIVSWGRAPLGAVDKCGHAELYSVYARVSNYYDWIADKVRNQ